MSQKCTMNPIPNPFGSMPPNDYRIDMTLGIDGKTPEMKEIEEDFADAISVSSHEKMTYFSSSIYEIQPTRTVQATRSPAGRF